MHILSYSKTWRGFLLGVGAAALLGLGSQRALALDTLSAAGLKAICGGEAFSVDAGPDACSAYIRGFVDGALVTDPAVALNVARELEGEESFAERAYRTRLGGRVERLGGSYLAEFCIPQPVPLREITVGVVEALDNAVAGPDPTISARLFVYEFLKRQYPCAEPED